MPYKPTGNPPGRPRKNLAPAVAEAAPASPEPTVRPVSRARRHFRREAEAVAPSNLIAPVKKRIRKRRRLILHPPVEG